jgi:hypothetical protein
MKRNKSFRSVMLIALLIALFATGVIELATMAFGPVIVFGVCVGIVIIAGIGLPLYQIMKRSH